MKIILNTLVSKKLFIIFIILAFITIEEIQKDGKLDQTDFNLNKNLVSTYSNIAKNNKELQMTIDK